MSAREAGIGMGGLIVGAVLGGLGWSMIQQREVLELPEAKTPKAETPSGALMSENARLKEEIRDLRAELDRKKLAIAAKERAKEQDEAPEEVRAKDPDASMVLFADAKYQKALDSIDWNAVGTSMKDMVPLIARLAEGLAAGEEMDLELAGEIQKLNGELLKAAQKIMEGKIPGTGINGSFTHPVVVANQLGAALKAAGLELSKEQQESLSRVMHYYAVKDESLRLVEGDREFKLDVLAEEIEFKDAFYQEARALMTPEQRKALYSEHSKGRARLDVFDSTLMLAQYARAMPCKDAAGLATNMSEKIASVIGVDASARKQLDAVVTQWSNQLPAEFWGEKASKLDRMGMMSGSRIRAAMKRQVALMRGVLANVKLSPEARARLVKSMVIMVPMPE